MVMSLNHFVYRFKNIIDVGQISVIACLYRRD